MNGTTIFQSEMEIEEVGKFLSEKILAGNELKGLEVGLFDEVPSIFMEQQFIGLRITLSGYPGYDKGQHYVFEMSTGYSEINFGSVNEKEDHVSDYLKMLVDYYIKDDCRFRIK